MEEQDKKDLKQEGLKYGVILGVVAIILTLLVYIVDVTLLVDWKYSISSLVIFMALTVYFGNKFRKQEMEGFMSFGQSYLFSFIVLMMSNLVMALFLMVLYNVIDPEVPDIVIDQTIENTESFLRQLGTDDEKIDEAIEQLEEDMPSNFTPGGILKNSWIYVLTSAFFSLIAGAIIKRSKPDFDY